MPDKKTPKVSPNSKEKDRQMSAVLRGARTMGPGRGGKGEAASKAATEAILMGSAPAAGSALPSGASGADAAKTVSKQRMAALLKAMQDSKRLPAPTTR